MESGGSGGWEDRPAEERRYVQLAPETVVNAADSIGIGDLSNSVASALAEDATYRLREIADLCSQFLRHSRKRTLTTDIFNRALKCKSVPPVIGHKKFRGGGVGGMEFRFVPEAEVFVNSDAEINLASEAFQNSGRQREQGLSVHASWLALQGKILMCATHRTQIYIQEKIGNTVTTPVLVQVLRISL
jgi:TATA box binding protein associated factor (TAF)